MSVGDARPVVLVVDDAPATLGALVQELESGGYDVLVAADGASALQRLDLVVPDVILLDAMMPGLDGFETCRLIQAQPRWAHIPVIFMTGLAETEHVVQGFAAGGVDYVVKPVRTEEVSARIATHVRNARSARFARDALDFGGLGVAVLDPRGRLAWRSPQAQAWIAESFPGPTGLEHFVSWLQRESVVPAAEPSRTTPDGTAVLVARRLDTIAWGETMWLLSRRAARDPAATRIAQAALTPRETQVLSWIAKGKTNRDVAEILGVSPRTVNKHLEHVFEKLGVETRAAAAALASREMQADDRLPAPAPKGAPQDPR